MLESQFEVWLVNAQHVKRVPGRKTDVSDAEWLASVMECGLVRASRQGGEDHYEVVFRLYESSNPRETGENHIGKLYVRVFGQHGNYRFVPYVERFEWHADGSFDVIAPDGTKHRVKP